MFRVREFLGGIVLVFLLGLGGFFYRAAVEKPYTGNAVCILSAKICPDGTVVGLKNAVSCTFAPCPFPNISLASAGISFALPAGYVAATSSSYRPPVVALYRLRASSASTTASLVIRDYTYSSGESPYAVIRAHLPLALSGTAAFLTATTTIGKYSFQNVPPHTSPAGTETTYYFIRSQDILRFDAIDGSSSQGLPAAHALRSLLETLSSKE